MSFLKFDEMEQLTELDIEELFKSEIIPETPKFVFKKISQPPVPFIVYHQEESIKRSLSTELIQPTTKRFLTNEEIMSTKHFVQGAETVNVREREFHRFLIYIKERGISQNLDNIELDKLSQYLGSYVLERTKEDGGIMDTTTLHAIGSRLSVAVSDILGFDINKHPGFKSFQVAKQTKLKLSKQAFGNGLNAHQSDVLEVEEISYFYRSGAINTSSGLGLINGLYLSFMTVLNNRAIKDNSSCKWGSLKVEKDGTGKFIKAELYPQNTKKDDGTSLGAQQGASKRPVILPVEDKQKCFFTFYRIYEDQRRRLSDKFGKDLMHPDSPFFLIPKEKRLFDKSDGILFKPKGMGPQHFKNLVFNMAIDSGLNILGRKITNTSLRVAAFHMQENIGIDAVTGRQFSGHVNPGTAATYRRKNKETSNKVGGALVEAFTGSLAIHPENYGKSLTKDLPLN